jgi:hypothetical protein
MPEEEDKELINQISNTINITVTEIESIIKTITELFPIGFNIQNITDVVIELMKIIGKINKLNGHDKKYLVTKLLIHIVNITDSGKYDEILDAVLLGVIPMFIDTLINVEKGKIVFNKKTHQTIKNCFTCCK